MNTVITFDPVLWSLLVGSLVPLVVAISTQLHASGGLKALVALFLTAVSSTIITLNQQVGNAFSWKLLGVTFAITFFANLTTYIGAWSPVLKINQKAFPSFGLGREESFKAA